MNPSSYFLWVGKAVGVCATYHAGICGSQRLILSGFLITFHLASLLVFVLLLRWGLIM